MAINDYHQDFIDASQQYPTVDAQLLRAMALTESSGNPNAVGPPTKYGKAQGLMQMIPETAKSLGVKNPFDPREAIFGGAKQMAENLERYKTAEKAIAAYHGGTDEENWGPKTQAYVKKVMGNYQNQKKTAQPTPAEEDDDAFLAQFGVGQTSAANTGAAGNDPMAGMSDDDFLRQFGVGDTATDIPSSSVTEKRSAGRSPTAQAITSGAGNPTELDRQIALTGRNLLEGAAGLPLLAGDAANTAANYGIQAINKIAGTNIPEYQMASEYASNLLTSAGAPTPQTPGERVVGDMTRAVGGTLSGVGVGNLLQAGARYGAPVVSAIGKTLASAPGMQTVTSAVGSGAAGLTREAGGSPEAQMAAGLIGSAAIPAATAALPKVVPGGAVRPEIAELAKTAAKDYGIDLPAASISQNPFVKWLDAVLPSVPLSGHGEELQNAKTQFSRAVSKTFGEDTPSLTREVMEDASERIGRDFDRLAEAIPEVKISDKTLENMATIGDEATEVLGQEGVVINKQINKILALSDQNGNISGKSMQSLLRSGTPLDRLTKSKDPNVAHYARGLKDTLFDALGESATPENSKAYATAREQWKNYKTVEDLAHKAGITGEINPALLLGQVNKTARRFGRGGMKDLQNLSDIGQTFLKELPKSGTAERTNAMKFVGPLGAGGALHALYTGDPGGAALILGTGAGSVAAARGASAILNSQWYKNRLMQSGMNPQSRPMLPQSYAPVAANIIANNALMGR